MAYTKLKGQIRGLIIRGDEEISDQEAKEIVSLSQTYLEYNPYINRIKGQKATTRGALIVVVYSVLYAVMKLLVPEKLVTDEIQNSLILVISGISVSVANGIVTRYQNRRKIQIRARE
jgi:hypothetical protein